MRRRLQLAALELYRNPGYDQTTAADIATRAGVTERTFFRHFPDKREVLFDGDATFGNALAAAVRAAPPGLGPWDTLFLAFLAVEPIFVENRAFAEPRQRLIAQCPALQERAMAKTRAMIASLAVALVERGVPDRQANLAAQLGAATLGHAVTAWFGDGTSKLRDQIARAFREVRELSAAGAEAIGGGPSTPHRARRRPPAAH